MNSVDRQYKELLNYILEKGVKKQDRTGTGTISVFDYSMRFDMKEGFPLLTSKKMFTKGVILELIWFLKGDTNIKFLVDNGCHIWDGDAYKNYISKGGKDYSEKSMKQISSHLSQEEFINKIKTDGEFAKKWGDLGSIYGKQWRKWNTNAISRRSSGTINEEGIVENLTFIEDSPIQIDQISILINDLKTNPDSRRLMVSAWNVGELDQMVLPPCHYGFQCYTYEMSTDERIKEWCDSLGKHISFADDINNEYLDQLNFPKRKLSLKWTQRSVDTFLGLPFNIASYGFLLHILAKETNMIPNELIFSGGDVHLYSNHIEQVKEQLNRKTFNLPQLELNYISIDNLELKDFKILNYQSGDILKGKLSN
jgi:thymidylate synthase